jgi:NAD(P)-dependent dehydrogenase (short-subunit alcohol dehydrogenase family)
MRLKLKNRVAIVTGAGRGLGRAYALELARRGARVLVNDAGFNLRGDDLGDHEPADSVVREIIAEGGLAVPSYHDISRPEQAMDLAGLALSAFGGLDILVNNAGNNRRATFPDMTLDDFRAVLDVHLLGAFVLTQAAYRHMVAKQHGRIVFTTSQVGFYGKVDSVAYGAAKNALIGLMHGVKLDAARHGIAVNCISPFALTRMGDIFPRELERLIAPQQVAAALAWLCSDACTLNGEIVIAGGGHFARAVTMESRGIDIDDPERISAELIGRRWRGISSMRRPLVFEDALKAVGATFEALKQRVAGDRTGTPKEGS